MLYHLSLNNNLTKLTPRIPTYADVSKEDCIHKRICFSDSIERCLMALQDGPYTTYYVYVPEKEFEIYSPTPQQVRDVEYTHEVWCLKPIKVKCIGIIKSGDYTSDPAIETKYGKVVISHYSYEWLEKYE